MMLAYIDSAYTIHSCQLECLLHGAKLFLLSHGSGQLNVTSVCIQEKGIPLQKFRNNSFAAIHQIFSDGTGGSSSQ